MTVDVRLVYSTIRKRPGMYLMTEPWIDALRNITFGLKFAYLQQDENTYFETMFFEKFDEFVGEELNIELSIGWNTMILQCAGGNRESLDLFYRIFEKFEESIRMD